MIRHAETATSSGIEAKLPEARILGPRYRKTREADTGLKQMTTTQQRAVQESLIGWRANTFTGIEDELRKALRDVANIRPDINRRFDRANCLHRQVQH